jgi:hypothetical protein
VSYDVFAQMRVVEMRRMARLRSGRLVLAPAASCVGDAVAICNGGEAPLLLRRVEGPHESFVLVGECFVHDVLRESFLKGRRQELYIV